MEMRFVSEDGRTLVVIPDEDGDGARLHILPASAGEEAAAEDPAEDGGFRLLRQDTRLLGNHLVVLAKTQAHR